MVYKLKTSSNTMKIFDSIKSVENLQPFVLAKLAIALSIKKGKLAGSDFVSDNNGLELSRQTIFGDHDLLFKSLIINLENELVDESDYFPKIVKAHLDRGATLLENEMRYSKNLFTHLITLNQSL